MTAADLATPAPGRVSLPLALSIALRELRAGAGGLIIFVICIALGVTAVAAIGSLSASFDEALARQGRLLVGGDLSFERVHRRARLPPRPPPAQPHTARAADATGWLVGNACSSAARPSA